MRTTDQMLSRLAAESEEKQQFVDGVIEAAEKDGRDLTPQELELVKRSRDRQQELSDQMEPIKEARRIGSESEERMREIAKLFGEKQATSPTEVEYRSAGQYTLDYWKAGLGAKDAQERIELYTRAAAHQTTADNPGLLPEQILGPIVNFVDESRPIVNAFGPRQLPSGSWSRPRVTQHTNVALQAGEKTELVSRKMTIGKVPVSAGTYGGYVNVSRQDIDWTSPSIMDIVINDLAGYYAQVTEDAAGDALLAGATSGPIIPTGPWTAAGISTAIWTAVASVYTATKGQGTVLVIASPDMYGNIAPIFPPVNPTNSQSAGFKASDLAAGAQGSYSGLTVILGPLLAAGTLIVASTAAFEVYEDRVGALSVVEPSVLGVQVAYAGYFAPLVIEAGGIQKIAKTA